MSFHRSPEILIEDTKSTTMKLSEGPRTPRGSSSIGSGNKKPRKTTPASPREAKLTSGNEVDPFTQPPLNSVAPIKPGEKKKNPRPSNPPRQPRQRSSSRSGKMGNTQSLGRM